MEPDKRFVFSEGWRVRPRLDTEPLMLGTAYVMGLDVARAPSHACLVVIEAPTGRMVSVTRFVAAGWLHLWVKLKTIAATWKPTVIWTEANSIGGQAIEPLQAEGLPIIPFTMTAQAKTILIESLALALERGDLTLLPDTMLTRELEWYITARQPDGRFRYGAWSGESDNTILALALAWHGITHSAIGISFV